MHVVVTHPVTIGHQAFVPGVVVDLPEETAEALVAAGSARPYQEGAAAEAIADQGGEQDSAGGSKRRKG